MDPTRRKMLKSGAAAMAGGGARSGLQQQTRERSATMSSLRKKAPVRSYHKEVQFRLPVASSPPPPPSFSGSCHPASLVAQQGAGQGAAPRAERVETPNYDLAAQWTSDKVRKLVFDTTVTPRWLETSDRFWYAYQTREGRQVLARRSDQADEGAALRSREDGRDADLDHAHSVRRAAPAVHLGAVREEGHRLRIRRAVPADAGLRRRRSARRPSSRALREPRQCADSSAGRRSRAAAAAPVAGAGGASGAPENQDAALRVRPGDRRGHVSRRLQRRSASAALGVVSHRTARPSCSRATTTSS